MQQADGNGFDPPLGKQLGDLPQLRGAERLQDSPVRGYALIDFEAEIPRHQRLWQPDSEVVDVVTRLPPELEHVTKARGGDQCGPPA